MQLQDGNNREGTLAVLHGERVSDTLSHEWPFQGVDPSPVADGTYFVSSAPEYQNYAPTADGTPINANWSNPNPNQQWIFKSYRNGIYTIVNGNGSYASFSQTNQTTLDGTLQANSQPCYWKVFRGAGAGYCIRAVDPTVKTSFGGTVLTLVSGTIRAPVTLNLKESSPVLNQQWTLRIFES